MNRNTPGAVSWRVRCPLRELPECRLLLSGFSLSLVWEVLHWRARGTRRALGTSEREESVVKGSRHGNTRPVLLHGQDRRVHRGTCWRLKGLTGEEGSRW